MTLLSKTERGGDSRELTRSLTYNKDFIKKSEAIRKEFLKVVEGYDKTGLSLGYLRFQEVFTNVE